MSSPISLADFNIANGRKSASRRLSKIVGTLGPACDAPDRILEMLVAGVDVFRINISHGRHEDHARRVHEVRKAARALRSHPAILIDLQGPRMRLGRFQNGEALIRTGTRVVLTADPVEGTGELIPTSCTDLIGAARPGHRILLADGAVEMRATALRASQIECEVISGGLVRNHQGINVPDSRLDLPALTARDQQDLEFGLELGIDFVALSFVRAAADVEHLREYLRKRERNVPIVAKIEKAEACHRLNEIISVSDGVMVARGDLGVEIGLPAIPAMQKLIIRRTLERGRFAITATQMFESMVHHSTSTRAEVIDVANAIEQGSGALMLSAETAIGDFPVETVRIMSKIALEAEQSMQHAGDLVFQPGCSVPEVIAACACLAAQALRAAAIVVSTATGATVHAISRYRPRVPVYAIVPGAAVARRLAVVYGALPLVAPGIRSAGDLERYVSVEMARTGLLSSGDAVLIVAGEPPGEQGTTNTVRFCRVDASEDASGVPARID